MGEDNRYSWKNAQGENRWDALGDNWVTFVNGKSKTINVKQFIRDHMGHPVLIEASDGCFYNWNTVISIQQVKRT